MEFYGTFFDLAAILSGLNARFVSSSSELTRNFFFYICKHLEGVNWLKNAVNAEEGASDWGKLCARREAQCRPTLEQNCSQLCKKKQKKQIVWSNFVNCSKKEISSAAPWRKSRQKFLTGPRLFCMFFFSVSPRLIEMHSENRFFFRIFYALLIFKALNKRKNTYNLAHMVFSVQQKAFFFFLITFEKGAQAGRSPHQEHELWTLNPWINKNKNKPETEK